MDLPSLTPTAEYIDMLYIRCLNEFPPIRGLKWCIVLVPPAKGDEGTGSIRIDGEYEDPDRERCGVRFQSDANMHAVQIGARASIYAMETVTNHHVSKFMTQLEDIRNGKASGHQDDGPERTQRPDDVRDGG
jgi:hypothetical protein